MSHEFYFSTFTIEERKEEPIEIKKKKAKQWKTFIWCLDAQRPSIQQTLLKYKAAVVFLQYLVENNPSAR